MKRMPRSTRFARMPLLVQEVAATSPTRLQLGDTCEAVHRWLACLFKNALPHVLCSTCACASQDISSSTFAQCSHSFARNVRLDRHRLPSRTLILQGKENNTSSGKGPKAKKRRAE